jgi:AcrR family transcriptional regulator
VSKLAAITISAPASTLDKAATTLREIAKVADVKLSLIGYHLESRLALCTRIFVRRQHVDEEWLHRLEAIENLDAPDALEKIVSAFMGGEPAGGRRLVPAARAARGGRLPPTRSDGRACSTRWSGSSSRR